MGYYCVALDLSGKLCLVIGGGLVAERKIRSLRECGAAVRVVSPDLTQNLSAMAASGEIFYRRGRYCPADLEGVFLVVSAADDENVNRQVAADCHQRHLLVNIVDDPEKCNFLVPATVRRGALTIAVSTGGRSPLLARKIREELSLTYGPQYGDFLDLIAGLRQDVIHHTADDRKKKEILEDMVSDEILADLKNCRMDRVKERVLSAYRGSGVKPQDSSG